MTTTPLERLVAKQALKDCRVCAWLATLDEATRKGWAQAIADRRFSHGMVAAEIMLDATPASGYFGPGIGESSVNTHRQRGHR